MMTMWRGVMMAAALAAGLGFCSTAKAGPMSFSYAGAPPFQIVNPTSSPFGGIAFTPGSGTGTGPNAGATGAQLSGVLSGSGIVGTFNHVAYSTGLSITDSTSSQSHTFNFNAELNGTLASGLDNLH